MQKTIFGQINALDRADCSLLLFMSEKVRENNQTIGYKLIFDLQ